jgi:hypothetical protein
MAAKHPVCIHRNLPIQDCTEIKDIMDLLAFAGRSFLDMVNEIRSQSAY